MKKVLFAGITLIIFVFVISLQMRRITALKTERNKYKNNTETLLKEVMQYKTRDNLNAVKVGVLELKLAEFEKYRADDLALIKSLQTKNRELQSVLTAKTVTTGKIEGTFKDSIIFMHESTKAQSRENENTDTLRCIEINTVWLELEGCMNKYGNFEGCYTSYDYLLIAVTAQYKRFLGFLWKTNKIKNRDVNAVSRNPNSYIVDIEYIEIRK